MAVELGCRVGSLPTIYLGLPLGAQHKAISMWDGVEERMRRRLALWKRQYISKGGRITLIKSTLASIPIYQLSLFRMPKIRFAFEKDNLWKKVIGVKYGKRAFGWWTNEARGTFGVGVWKEILKETNWCWDNIEFKVGKGTKVKNATVNEVWDSSLGQGGWNLRFSRDFNDWELDLIGDLLNMLRDFRISLEDDLVLWKGGGHGTFGVRDAYTCSLFPTPLPSRKSAFGWIRSNQSCFFCLGGHVGEDFHLG
ncbi:hypothetical protein CK203_091747 [Vitis vinifera]|uniref:Uncharacterized protein n=1 Tax=Vitis vinifera TaxID=29760 RepID=A0A438EJ71_VITVI|nr:hypothetical protein CK203_091747 [Vitis vinifera]